MVTIIISLLLNLATTINPTQPANQSSATTMSAQESETVEAFGGSSTWNDVVK